MRYIRYECHLHPLGFHLLFKAFVEAPVDIHVCPVVSFDIPVYDDRFKDRGNDKGEGSRQQE